ncbi:MAG: ATP-binding protein [Bordetella sp.]|nr:ATP-binding protein [Pseudomonadota bacterium]
MTPLGRGPFDIDRQPVGGSPSTAAKPPQLQALRIFADAAIALQALTADFRDALATTEAALAQRPGSHGDLLVGPLHRPVRTADLLAQQMLAYAGAQQLTPASVDLLPLLSGLAGVLRRTLDPRLCVCVDVAHGCPPCHADAQALREALINLVVNARDAMPDGGRIRLSAAPVTAEGGLPAVAVSVSDNGVGMTPEFARRAVQPFVTTKDNAPSAGMGLAASDGFARQSNGFLKIDSRAGSGVTVTLVLPQATQAHRTDS